MEHSYAIYEFVLMVVIVALSVYFNDPKSDWYQSLNKPYGVPPDWTFGVVWSLLYFILLIGVIIATWNQMGEWSWNIVVTYTVILVLTLLWVVVFSYYERIIPGAIILLATVAVTGYMLYLLSPSHLLEMGIGGGAEYVPMIFYVLFLIWILCATYFNIGIAALN